MAMRLLVFAEGQTEETFVTELLSGHFFSDVQERRRRVSTRTLVKEMGKPSGGGVPNWDQARRLIKRKLMRDQDCIVTTMVDYYGLPKSWINQAEYTGKSTTVKAEAVRSKLAKDIRDDIPDARIHCRFVPYVSLHEFEGLLFSDCEMLAKGIEHPEYLDRLERIRRSLRGGSPEDINENYDSTPARRLKEIMPEYEKVYHGVLAATEVTIDVMRRECPEFNRWVEELKQRFD